MDVKYIPKDWERMREGLGDLKEMFNSLLELNDNLEEIKADIAKYDSDGIISFHHTSQRNKYQALSEDFEVLHSFAGKVGDIVDGTIDQPFYKDMDAFVEAMSNLSISNYTTKNRLGITVDVPSPEGLSTPIKVEKTEVSLEDLFSGDSFYAKQMKLEFEAWKKLHPSQKFSFEEYRQAALNTQAFEYNSIRNQQQNKEFWGQIIALGVIVTASFICPPVGLALGAVYGSLELGSAVTGKDWISGRELGTGERWFRGLLSPLDIVPGGSSITKFSGTTTKLLKFSETTGLLKEKNVIKTTVDSSINNLVEKAQIATSSRLKSVKALAQDTANFMKNKLKDDTIEAGRLIDRAATSLKNLIPPRKMGYALEDIGDEKGLGTSAENTHTVENKAKDLWRSIEGVNLRDVTKGTVVKVRQIGYTKGFDVEPKYSSYEQRVKTTPVNKGEWSSERAESLFISDKTGEIKKYLDEAGVDGVEYKNGMPDFSPFSKGEVKLDNMTNDRKSNFSIADEELAKRWSTLEHKWTAEDIADWREDNKYTWHELNDLKTIQLVPSKINSVFKHLGGVGEFNIKVQLGE